MKKLIGLLVFLIAGCSDQKTITTSSDNPSNENGVPQYTELQNGGVKMISIDGKYQVWTKKIGSGNIKVLLLHGGPGFPHDYYECFEDFFPQSGIEIYYYDQLGCGNSDIPTDTSLWNIARYVEEVEQVRKGLGLEKFYLYGQSWGGMLAMEYLQKYQDHVKAAVISNMTAGMKSYTGYTSRLKQKLFTSKKSKPTILWTS